MKRHLKKGTVVFVTLALVMFMASSAMALILTGRSEEMTANSSCDLAGTAEIKFTETDFNLISGYLSNVNTPKLDGSGVRPVGVGNANYVLIRATLGGELIDINADEPRLCKDIVGDNSALGAAGLALPNSGKLVVLDVLDIEVSDISNNTPGGPGAGVAADTVEDVTAYVYGKSGQQYFSVYVTDLQVATNWDDERTWPWIKVGLYDEVDSDSPDWTDTGDDGFGTEICADIHDFGTNARLLISLDIEPTSLTYTTSDNQIGHMLRGDVDITDCGKAENCQNADTSEIPLCGIEEQADCVPYYKCILAEGTFPSSGQLFLVVRSNGATNDANTQEGIYIENVAVFNEGGDPLSNFSYFPAAGPNNDRSNEWGDEADEDMRCTWVVEYAETEIDAGLIDGEKLIICVTYDVNPEHVTRDADGEILNPTVQFWVSITSIPCGEIANDSVDAATLIECGQDETCMYFPYLVQNVPGAPVMWTTGIAITNLSDAVPVEEMEIIATLTDSTGVAFTGTLPESMVTGKVIAFTLEGLVQTMGWEIAAGPAWCEFMGNFIIDGYSFIFADLGFGAGTLPRVLDHCNTLDLR